MRVEGLVLAGDEGADKVRREVTYRNGIAGYTKVPMKINAISAKMKYLKYFFIIKCLFSIYYSSLIASTGLILIALSAGASPASTPNAVKISTADIAVQNPIWK